MIEQSESDAALHAEIERLNRVCAIRTMESMGWETRCEEAQWNAADEVTQWQAQYTELAGLANDALAKVEQLTEALGQAQARERELLIALRDGFTSEDSELIDGAMCWIDEQPWSDEEEVSESGDRLYRALVASEAAIVASGHTVRGDQRP